MASGQMAATQTTMEGKASGQHPVSVLLYNTDSGNDTVTLQVLAGTGNPDAGNARTVAQFILGPGESAAVAGIPLGPTDVLQGQATNAAKVNYITSPLAGLPPVPFAVQLFDVNGAVKTNPNLTTGALVNPAINFKNMLDGGDFTVNPFQRNVAGLATANVLTTAIANTPGYFADRWFGVSGGAGGQVLFTKVADATIAGFSQALKFSRKAANADVNIITFGQVMETADSIRAQGQQVTFSFWAKIGANYSGATGPTVTLYSGTGTDQSAASMVAGTWTGSTTPISVVQTLTTSWVRYSFTGTVPTGCTQLGVAVAFTPVGTAGADDSISFIGLQLELGGQATAFEHRDVQVELEICQRYAWLTPEPAASVIVGSGMNTTAAIQIFYMATPVQFRSAPTVTVSAGTFKTNQASVATATTITAGTTHTPNAISVNGNSAGVAGQGTLLQGGGGTGYILASSDY